MKRIQRAALENFRGIRAGTVDGLVDVNVIVGKNNSGKSTFVEALLRCGEAISESPRRGDVAGRSRYDLLGQQRGDENNIGVVPFRDTSGAVAKVETSDGPVSVSFSVTGLTPQYARGPMALSGVTCFFPSDARDPDIERKLWPGVLKTRRDKQLAAALSDIFGMEVESVALLDNRAMLLFADHGLPLDAQGDGARAAFRALAMLGAMKDAPFILEEPECHQHPGSLRRFALAVVKLAKTNGVQLFVTTHSGECVAAFLEASKEAQSEAAVFHFALSDGAFEARKLDTQTAETLAATGTDVRFLSLYA